MRADFPVFGKDPTKIPPKELLTTSVVFTIVGGVVEYDGSKYRRGVSGGELTPLADAA
jgi:hypothetical protein